MASLLEDVLAGYFSPGLSALRADLDLLDADFCAAAPAAHLRLADMGQALTVCSYCTSVFPRRARRALEAGRYGSGPDTMTILRPYCDHTVTIL
jgi:hypothetical protein